MVGIPIGWSKFKLLGIRIMGNPPKAKVRDKENPNGKEWADVLHVSLRSFCS